MNKQKIMAAAAGAIVAVTSLAGASLAYFTDTKTAANVFTMGNVRIALDETDVQNPNGDRVTANTYAVYPGAVVTKDPVVHNTGANGAYVRTTVNVSDWVHMVSRYFPAFAAEFPSADYGAALELLVDELGDGWSVVGVQRGDVFTDAQQDAKFVLKYDGVLAAGADTTAMFCTVQVPTGIDNDSAAQFRAIDVTAQAIQQDGFANWEAAFAAFDAA